jgi:hypothetical protein
MAFPTLELFPDKSALRFGEFDWGLLKSLHPKLSTSKYNANSAISEWASSENVARWS